MEDREPPAARYLTARDITGIYSLIRFIHETKILRLPVKFSYFMRWDGMGLMNASNWS